MPVDNIPGATTHILQSTMGPLTDELYYDEKRITGTGLVNGNNEVDVNTETFVGQTRWRQNIIVNENVGSITDAADGVTSSYATEMLKYVKTVRAYGADQVNLKKLITNDDEFKKHARDFAHIRAQREHMALLHVLRGVALSELLVGACSASGAAGLGGQTFDNDPEDDRYGFYVDAGASGLVADATAARQGAARAEIFLRAFGQAFKDYEPPYLYAITSPETVASLRSANLIDADRVTDGNMTFDSIFNGKLRLIQTRAQQGPTSAEFTKINTGAGVNVGGTKTTFLCLPGALGFNNLNIEEPVAVDASARSYHGTGAKSIWYRWGFIITPQGYSWNGLETEFASNEAYHSVVEGGVPKQLAAVTDIDDAVGVWTKKFTSALAMGILPVFHG